MQPTARLLTLTLALAIAAIAPARASFTQRAEFGTGATIGTAWGDPDRDGDLDLAVTNFQAPNQLYTNNGDGTFTGTPQFGNGASFAVTWADADNDGDADLAVGRASNQQNYLYVNNDNGTYTQQNQFGMLRTIALAWGDFDGDGDLDMAVGNGLLGTAEQNYLYVNNGDGTFTSRPEFGTGQTGSLVWGDCDNDGDLDMAVGNGGFGFVGQNYLYVNNGNGTFTGREEFGARDTAALAWGDADNDGDLDMAVGNWNAGGCLLYLNNGDGTFTAQEQFGARDTNTIAWGDFDNDGDLDLATGNGDFQSAEQNYLYVNQGDGTFIETPEFGLGSTDSVVWGDFDGDGDLDLAVGNEHSPTQNYLYVNEENDGAGLDIHLVGHFHDLGAGYSNRDGVGAHVAVYEGGHIGEADRLIGYREVEAHGGFSSQNAIDPHFGCGGFAAVDVRILWPGSAGRRILQEVAGVAPGQRIVVEEAGMPADAGEGDRGGLLPAIRVAPNPVRDRARIDLLGSLSTAEAVRICDASGRTVRELSLPAGAGNAGTSVHWDGRDRGGNPLPAGIYFVAPRNEPRQAARVLLLR